MSVPFVSRQGLDVASFPDQALDKSTRTRDAMKRAAALTAGFFVLCSCGGSSDQGGSGASAPEAASEFSFRDAGDMTAIADFQAAAPPPPPPPPPPRADDVGPPDETPTSG
ncbi:MAG: hypothetical protein AAFQ67_09485, partial [Pseudomonadota bacterium]